MKTIEELRNAYVAPIVEAHAECRWCDAGELEEMLNEAYIAGATASQEWISIDDELPPVGVEILVKDIIDNHTMFYVCIYDRDFRDFYTNDWEHSLIASKIWRPIEYK